MTTSSRPKRGKGRPPIPKAEHRNRLVSVRFTAEEFLRLKTLAAKQPLSSYLREKGLGLA